MFFLSHLAGDRQLVAAGGANVPLFGDPAASMSLPGLGGSGGGFGLGPGVGYGGRSGPPSGLRPNARFASHPDLSMLNGQHQASGLLGPGAGFRPPMRQQPGPQAAGAGGFGVPAGPQVTTCPAGNMQLP